MTAFEVRNPDYKALVQTSFDDQALMQTMGMAITQIAPGQAEFSMPFNPAFTQQHGFMHAAGTTAGMDTACGCAALSLMPPDSGVLTVEFKTSLLAPAAGDRFRFTGSVVKPGRTLIFTEGQAFAQTGTGEKLIATMTATMMCVQDRPEVKG